MRLRRRERRAGCVRRAAARDCHRGTRAASRHAAGRHQDRGLVQSKGNRVNKFEFVVISGARAHQLLRGCTPKTTGPEKKIKLAVKEVKEGKVERIRESVNR
ncbi:MAG: hypothetical protein DMF85_14835 [Acidobacteria bacterium]|nr:MAG: hypothetical protein DMF85_14835 [Acidobacteriota bacterium]